MPAVGQVSHWTPYSQQVPWGEVRWAQRMGLGLVLHRTYTRVLEQGTEDSPADGVGVLYTEGDEGHFEKPGGRRRQGADLVTRESHKSQGHIFPLGLFISHTFQKAG